MFRNALYNAQPLIQRISFDEVKGSSSDARHNVSEHCFHSENLVCYSGKNYTTSSCFSGIEAVETERQKEEQTVSQIWLYR